MGVARAPIFIGFALLSACAGGGAEAEPARTSTRPPGPSGPSVAFVYATTTGDELSSATTRGRATAILFITTYDLSSQLLARRLDLVLRRHTPRANAAAIVLEPPKHAVMADAFRTSLKLSYPVAMGTDGNGSGGPFGLIDRVPTLVILDRSGGETFRHHGVITEHELEAALAVASKRGSAFAP